MPYKILLNNAIHPLPDFLQLPTFAWQYVTSLNNEENGFVLENNILYWQEHHKQRFTIDWLANQLIWRYQHINKSQEPLLRAIGWHAQKPPKVWDLTAGLGKDACLMAAAGCEVHLFERHPVLQILLHYAHQQAQLSEWSFFQHMHLHLMSAETWIKINPTVNLPEVAYFDPMYPERKKQALVKLELRMIKTLVGNDEDAATVLTALLQQGIPKIVVKRPKGATPLLANVHHVIQAPNTRFDVYYS